jgi:hypothetical protein
MDLTAESLEFVRERPGSHRLEVALAPLGHFHSREAPAGLVIARTPEAPVPGPSPGLLFAFRPRLWRRDARSSSTPGNLESSASGDLPMPAELTSEPPTPIAEAAEVEAGWDPEPAPSAVPEGRDVQASGVAPDRPLPAAPQPRPVRVVSQPLSALTTVSRLTRAPEASPEPHTAISHSVQRSEPSSSTETPASEPRLNLGQSRRRGLGLRIQQPPASPAAAGEIAGEPAPISGEAEAAAEAAEASPVPSPPVQAITAGLADDAGERTPAVAAPSGAPSQPGASVGDVTPGSPDLPSPGSPSVPSSSLSPASVAQPSTPSPPVSPSATRPSGAGQPRPLRLGSPIRREPAAAQRTASEPPSSAPPSAGLPVSQSQTPMTVEDLSRERTAQRPGTGSPPDTAQHLGQALGSPILRQPEVAQRAPGERRHAAEPTATMGEVPSLQPSGPAGGPVGAPSAAEAESTAPGPTAVPAREQRPQPETASAGGGAETPASSAASEPGPRIMRPIVRVQRRPMEVPGGPRPEALPPLAQPPTSPPGIASGISDSTGDAADLEAQHRPETSASMPEEPPSRSDQPQSQGLWNRAEPAAGGADPGSWGGPESSIQGWFQTAPRGQPSQGPTGLGQVLRTGRSRPPVQEPGPQPPETVRPLAAAFPRLVSLAPLVHVQPAAQRLLSEAPPWHLEPAGMPAGAAAEPPPRAWMPAEPAEAVSVREVPVARFAEGGAARAARGSSLWHEVSPAPIQPLIHLQSPQPPPPVPPPLIQPSRSQPSPQAGPILDPVAPAVFAVSRQAEGTQSAAEVVAGGGATHDSGAGARSEAELDELAGRLYDRFRSRLRMELLVSRERAGIVTDLK